MKRALVGLVCLVVFAGMGSSFAVSDGHYRPSRNHCKNTDENSLTADGQPNGKYVNPDCKSLIWTLSDGTGHEYLGAGTRQTPDGTYANTIDFWFDPGNGQKAIWSVGQNGMTPPTIVPGDTHTDPSTGLFIYFGADDNLDGGEHDSSHLINNGPSDGGGMEYNIDPATAASWAAALQAQDAATFLENPIPLFNGGMGACADGFCMSMDTTRRVAYEGLDTTKHRDVANYIWSDKTQQQWDPYNCAGPSDSVQYCQDDKHPGWTIADWEAQNGTTYIEPGFQIYEDPDPQGSPGVLSLVGIPQQDPYPLPALYFGSCGAVLGGGPMGQFPPGPNVNAVGQLVISTACN